jgi:hypothetical protein
MREFSKKETGCFKRFRKRLKDTSCGEQRIAHAGFMDEPTFLLKEEKLLETLGGFYVSFRCRFVLVSFCSFNSESDCTKFLSTEGSYGTIKKIKT